MLMDRGSQAWVRLLCLSAAALGLWLGGCSKIEQAARSLEPGKASLDSAIPPNLAPRYFPPQGFVWGAYKPKDLPEVRYGVASPPVNPKAQVLILADASYPAEVYFQAAQQLLDAGYGVWLLEAPGQGGSGRYLLQPEAIFAPDYHDARTAASGFIRDIIKPDAQKPLVIAGSGYSAIHVLAMSEGEPSPVIRGYVAYDPYLGGPIARGQPWHADAPPGTYWGDIAQAWQVANPSLRLRLRSDAWQKQMMKAYQELDGPNLSVLKAVIGEKSPPSVLLIAPKGGLTADANAASRLCSHVAHCVMVSGDGPDRLGVAVAGFMAGLLPKDAGAQGAVKP
ncbi:MAG: hypothetical protein ACXU8O_08070 [Asticcacaulis sp.]